MGVNEKLNELERRLMTEYQLRKLDFSYWAHLKNKIFIVESKVSDSKSGGVSFFDLISVAAVRIFFLSIIRLIKAYFSKSKKPIFFGALSTLKMTSSGVAYDSHHPKYAGATEASDMINFVNAGSSDRLSIFTQYLDTNSAISDNVIAKPICILIRIFMPFLLKKYKCDFKAQIIIKHMREIGFDNVPSWEFLSKIIQEFYALRTWYIVLLRNLPVTKIYLLSSYSKSFVVCAAKQLDIHVVELQHGYIGFAHRGYNYQPNCPSDYFPDTVLLYNKFWENNISSLKYLEKFNFQVINSERFPYYIEEKSDIDSKYVLVTGQGIAYDEIKNCLSKILDICYKNKVCVIYQPHPREDLSIIKKDEFFTRAVTLYNGSQPTMQLIKNCTAHLSVYSTCHFDALNTIGKTFVIPSKSFSFFNYYCSSYPNEFVLLDEPGLEVFSKCLQQ